MEIYGWLSSKSRLELRVGNINVYYFNDECMILYLILYVDDVYLTKNQVSKLEWFCKKIKN
jgi:hypothetical protein